MRKIVDEKFKDASPVDTVERIKKLLKEIGLSVTEEWGENTVSHCYALNLRLDNTSFSTNGKGVTEELARASAYAEMMERLQTGLLGVGARISFSDEVLMDFDTLKETSGEWYEHVAKIVKDFDGVEVSADKVMQAGFDYNGDDEKVSVIPFYSVLDDKMVYLPATLRIPLYSSSGLAAGNTPEEAMVQGMSELWERWCQRHFLCKDLVPPTIPDEYLQQFPMAYETIQQVRDCGYEVIIKDCSMGSGWPAIATVVISKETHAYHVHMGSSPVFEIALGRSLTETFQGRKLQDVTDTYLTESAKDAHTYRKSFVKGRGAYPINFFTDEPTFPFVPFEDRTKCTNKELLKYVINFFKERGMDIYARDMTHMGFHTYQIIVPQICNTHFGFLTYDLNIPKLVGRTQKIHRNIKSATKDQLYELQLLNLYRVNYSFVDKNPKSSLLIYLPLANRMMERVLGYVQLAYTEWECDNIGGAYKFAQIIENFNVPGVSDYCSCLSKARSMVRKGEDLDVVLKRLSLFYKDEYVEEVRKVLTEKTNPFAAYVVSCGERREKCAGCKYEDICLINANKDLGEVINKYVEAFDNDAAFKKLIKLFKETI